MNEGTDGMIYIRNWRDVQPKIAHMSAVHWGGLRSRNDDDPNPNDDRDRLERLGGFARHALQGRKTSDYHKHDTTEQVYYVLSGAGEVLYDDKRYPVSGGDAIYLPAGVHHQMFNDDNDAWLEHHVISQRVDSSGGTFAVKSWRDVPPVTDGAGAVRWQQLGPVDEGGHLRAMASIRREAVQPQGTSAWRTEAVEQVYYGLEGVGLVEVEGEGECRFMEGDMLHLPVGSRFRLRNPSEHWLVSLIMAA